MSFKIFKILSIAGIILLTSVINLLAQNADLTEQASPGIAVTKLKWSKQVNLPPPPVGFDASQDAPSANRFPTSDNAFPFGRRPSVYYSYQALFTNNGDKKIKGILWEYIFRDADSKAELGRHTFSSYKKIAGNKSATVTDTAISPPTKIVSAKALEVNKRSPYLEQVEIKCVLYDDNTLWQMPQVKAKTCEQFKSNSKRKRRRQF